MRRQVLIIGHADADGHLIVEQTRRNLALLPCFDVTTIVDPARTKDHKVWHKLREFPQIEAADIVFFVDMMFSPVSFAAEAQALVDFVQSHHHKRFFLIDHHPIPFRRMGRATNLRAAYRPEVFECTFGPRSGLMVVAALCEKQGSQVSDIKKPEHELLAIGVRRAAALGGPLPGEKLLALMHADRWDALSELGRDSREFHRLPRGLRPAKDRWSDTLLELNEIAALLLTEVNGYESRSPSVTKTGETAMPYDVDALQNFDIGSERFQRGVSLGEQRSNAPTDPHDLESIVTLLEVAALSLTAEPDAAFTYNELLREAQELCGDELEIDERDVKIVLGKASFLRKSGSEYRLK